MMPSVSITRSVPLNSWVVVPLLRSRLERLEEASEHGTVLLASGRAGEGHLVVPVRLRVRYSAPRTPRFALAVSAHAAPRLQPRFHGELRLAEAGIGATILTLTGFYETAGVPYRLESLFDRLVAEIVADGAQHRDEAAG